MFLSHAFAITLPQVIVTTAFFFTSAITKFDVTLTQAINTGAALPGETRLPHWIGWLFWVHWGLIIALFVLNWRFAILVYAVRSVLSFLGIMAIIGSILVIPIRQRPKF